MVYFKIEFIRALFAVGIIDIGGVLLSLVLGEFDFVLVFSFIFGSVFAFLNLLLLAKTVVSALDKPTPAAGKSYLRLNYVLRYLILGIVIALSFTRPFLTPWGVIPPLFGPKLGIQIGGILNIGENDNTKKGK